MYLKKYDLTRVSDDVIKEMFALMFEEESATNIKITLIEMCSLIDVISISDDGYEDSFTISNTGDIIMYCNGEYTSINCLQKVSHLLLNTQWRDPKVELPEMDCDVYVKIEKGVLFGKYRKSQKYFNFGFGDGMFHKINSDELDGYSWILGWLPAENVVL